jgi:hypothetical protein
MVVYVKYTPSVVPRTDHGWPFRISRPNKAARAGSSLPTLSPIISGLIIFAFFILLGVVLFGCSGQRTVSAPSSAAVQGDIARAQSHMEAAAAELDEIGKRNKEARALAERIHDKNVLIERWRMEQGR